tara:strand:+ start:100 stop:402 length:303 start_codon:yes stop_codon:yes gene_type:complete
MNIKKIKIDWNNVIKYSFYTLLFSIFCLNLWNYKTNNTEKHKQYLNTVVALSKLNGMLEYQKAILIEVRNANKEDRNIEFKNVNIISGFNKLDSLNNNYK